MQQILRPVALILCLLTFGLYAPAQISMPVSNHFRIEKLAEGIFATINNDNGGAAICNAGIIDLGNKTIVIDPFLTPEAAVDLKSAAEYLTGRPVAYVINTHYHNDHTRGNQVFKPESDIIATSFTRDQLQKTFYEQISSERRMTPGFIEKLEEGMASAEGHELAEMKLWYGYYKTKLRSLDDLRLTLPDITVDDSLTIYGSERSLKVIATGKGHTGGDLVVFLPESKTIFMGDLLFKERHPFLGAGDPALWKQKIELIAQDYQPEITVPGHGPIGNKESINTMSEYIATLTNIIKEGIDTNKSEGDILASPVPSEYAQWLLGTFYPMNLKVLYDQQQDRK